MNGLPYYKAYPRDFIEGTIGMDFETKGAYRLVIDLIYMQGGRLPDDSRYISGLLGCSVRKWNSIREKLLSSGKLEIIGEFLSNYRADKELETLRKVQEQNAENRRGSNKNKDLQKRPSIHTEPEPDIDDDDTRATMTDRERLLEAMGHGSQDCTAGGRIMGNQNDMLEASKWSDDLGLTLDEQCAVIRDVTGKATSQISSFKYFSGPMVDYAGRKKQRLEPTEMRVIRGGGRPPPEVDQQTIIRSAAAGTTNKSQEW
ncbi:DUF1376 domain-containing protein [Celeribacter naphthalenivorans]|uniref:DUF1376 domain-containing protein n=1 Tax=Celeribacter naphthalenivorans TaxID=1614694 RepID=UPI001CFA364B|nr:DUF1376 domain-containing protein [Celeribacter naphthalenivorans]